MKKASRKGSFLSRHPIASGMAAGTAVTAAALVPAAKAAMPFLARGMKGEGRVIEAAKKAYPSVRKLWSEGQGVQRGSALAQAAGGAFSHPQVHRYGAPFNPMTHLAKLHPDSRKALAMIEGESKKIALHLPVKQHAAIAAHELGHAAMHLGKFGGVTRRVAGVSVGSTRSGSALLGSMVAHPVIEHTKLSRKNKNRLHLAAGIAPIAMAAPMMADEAQATYKGLKIMKAAGFKAKQMSHARRGLAAAYGTYAGLAGGQAVQSAVMTKGYRRRK